jgi:nucleoid-associated protein YgaU
MSRYSSLALAACLTLAGSSLAYSQDARHDAASLAPLVLAQEDGSGSGTASGGNDVASLQAENAALKKEVSDAQHTIAELQSQLAQAGIKNQATTAPASPAEATPDNAAPGGPVAATSAPSGPMKALPLDATNVVTTPGEPGAPAADAGPSKTYKVVKGDSLWKIAHKMYPGDTKNGVDKIQEANKDAIGGKPLKIGQVLVIPQ